MKETTIIEEFCPPCMALPLAFAGTGSAYGTSNDWVFWASIILTIMSIAVYFYYKKNKCSTC